MLIKYIKSVVWRVAKLLSYIEDAQCLKVKSTVGKVGISLHDLKHSGPLTLNVKALI